MQILELDLTVGDSFRVGNHIVTLIDVDGSDAAFRIDDLHSEHDDKRPDPPAK